MPLSNETKTLIQSVKTKLIEKLDIQDEPTPLPKKLMDDPFFPHLSTNALEAIHRNKGGLELARTIDHTILKPEALPAQVDALCAQAISNRFRAVCVNGAYVKTAKQRLGEDEEIGLAAVIGFPLGQMATAAKVCETKEAVEAGADEIDMVINIGRLKAGLYNDVFEDIKAVVGSCEAGVKVIIETCLLTDEEKIEACLLSLFAGAAFVKTSTGFSTGGATLDDVRLMRESVGDKIGVKASGGIKTFDDALAMLQAGANRLGTSSGIQIVGG